MLNPVMAQMLAAEHVHDLRAAACAQRRARALRSATHGRPGRVRSVGTGLRARVETLVPARAVGCEA